MRTTWAERMPPAIISPQEQNFVIRDFNHAHIAGLEVGGASD